MPNELSSIKSCPVCGSDNLVVTSREQIICKDCGLVHEPFSAVSKEVLEITHPAETAIGGAAERVAIKMPRMPALKRVVRKAEPKLKARKAGKLIKKAGAKKVKAKKAKAGSGQKKMAKKRVAAVKKPEVVEVRKERLGLKARLRKLIRR